MGQILIYIREGGMPQDCWVPAEAQHVSGDTYRVTSIPADKQLEFGVGDLVRCDRRAFPDGSEALLALGPATPPS